MTSGSPDPVLAAELEDLRTRLAEAEETLRAIRGGEVDALVLAGDQGEKVHLLGQGDRIYRQFIETISEGTATVSADGDILSCNAALAKTLRRPLVQVLGTAMRDHLSPEDHEAFTRHPRTSRHGVSPPEDPPENQRRTPGAGVYVGNAAAKC